MTIGDKFNYVYFQACYDYYKINYNQVINADNFCYRDRITYQGKNLFLKYLCRLHYHPRMNMVFRLPFKSIWYYSFIGYKFLYNRPICFIIDPYYLSKKDYVDYFIWLKKHCHNSKFVLFFEDLICKYEKDIDLVYWRSFFDIIISFDREESLKNDIEYHPTVSSYVNVEKSDDIPESDFYMLIQAKDRLPKIINLYKHLASKNFKCVFFVSNVSKEKRDLSDEIHYIDTPISYKDNLKYISKTKCIVELMQGGAIGYTLRLWEAILYDKKLVTDNRCLLDSEFYDDRYIDIIDFDDLENTVFSREKIDNLYINPYKKKVTPDNLLIFIEKKLKQYEKTQS